MKHVSLRAGEAHLTCQSVGDAWGGEWELKGRGERVWVDVVPAFQDE